MGFEQTNFRLWIYHFLLFTSEATSIFTIHWFIYRGSRISVANTPSSLWRLTLPP